MVSGFADVNPSGEQLNKTAEKRRLIPAANQITGVVLAGGAGIRFGCDKAMVLLGGRPMALIVAQRISQVAHLVYINHPDATLWRGLGFSTIHDRYAGMGPLAGLHAALIAGATEWILSAPCDAPLLSAASIRRLTDAADADSNAIIAVDGDKRLHPVIGLYRSSVKDRVDEYLNSGRRSVHGFLRRIGGVRHVVLPDADLTNVNYPEDLTSVTMSLNPKQ